MGVGLGVAVGDAVGAGVGANVGVGVDVGATVGARVGGTTISADLEEPLHAASVARSIKAISFASEFNLDEGIGAFLFSFEQCDEFSGIIVVKWRDATRLR